VIEAKLRAEIPANAIHVCVDMQRLFAEQTPWYLPWMDRVRPTVHRIAAHRPMQTIFTRFIPPMRTEDEHGQWRAYYQRWSVMTRSRLDSTLLNLVPELAALCPPARRFDKARYSPWRDGRLQRHIDRRGGDTLIITGGETDICVIATILGAVDNGYRVVVVADALCSTSDAAHDAALRIYSERFTEQVEICDSVMLLDVWRQVD
jgi:nicotinamidase-related amidase